MKRIYFFAPRFHTNQYYLTKSLIRNGFEVKYFTIYKSKSEDYKYLIPISIEPSIFFKIIRRLKKKQSLEDGKYFLRKYYVPSFRKLFLALYPHKPDFIVIRNLKSIFSISVLIISKILFIRVILYTQNPLYYKYKFLKQFMFQILHFFGIIHFTPVLGNENEKRLSKESFYIPFIIEPLYIKNKISGNDKINILVVAKMQKRKMILELIKLIVDIKYKVFITIVGECISDMNYNYYFNLIKYIEENKLSNRVSIKINIPYPAMLEEYSNADIFILPSHDEPAAFSIVEAMACSLPVICSDKNGTRCYIEEGINGFIFTFDPSLNNLLNLLNLILRDKRRIFEMGNNSIQTINKKHGIEKFLYILEKE